MENPARERRIRRVLTGYYVANVIVMGGSVATAGVLGMLLALSIQLALLPLQVHRWTWAMGGPDRGYVSATSF